MSTLLVVTGATRGFGRCLLLSFARTVSGPLFAIITGRNAAALEESKQLVHKIAPPATVIASVFDMSDLDSIQPAWETALTAAQSAAGAAGISRAILVNNSGSLGDTCAVADLPGVSSLRQAVDSNVTATAWLTSLFVRWLQSPSAPSSGSSPLPSVIINVSSLAAVKPFPTQLVYCLGKAARDMLTAGLAEELQQAEEAGKLKCHVKTLNYAPGPLDTDMQGQLRDSATLHGPARDFFLKIKADGSLIDPQDSADKCARIISTGKYVSGSHVDYYDPEPS